MKKIPGLAGRVRVGAPDASLTPVSGVVAVAELVGRLGVTAALDDAVGRIKQRDRGLSGGEFLVAVAQAQMCGAQFWVGLDRRRADTAGEALSAVPTPAASTAVELASRFGPAQVAGIEEGIGEIACRVVGLLPAARRAVLRTGGATIDLDGTDVEVYGAKKEGIAYSYKGARAGRPHVATWAEAGVVTAADLLAGDEDPRPGAGSLIERSVATLNAAGVTARPKVRGDVGYFAKDIAQAAVEAGCDFSLGVTRNPAVWRAAAAIPDDAWRKAERMKGAQVAVCDYAPAGWPPATMTVVRRVKVHATDISADPRARRRRTIPKAQLTLALDGLVGHVYAYSFIATNLDVSTPAKTVAVEAWHRMRTDIEDRIRDAKHGAALRHLPSGSRAANTVWMWGALLAVNLSAWLQELAGLDDGDGRGRNHLGTLRHRLITVPARLVRHARQVTLRLPPRQQLLAQVLARLRRLPIWT
ncbi:IS1380 family transposase [Micromonospora sp. WMMA1363]|uniref:IS1380 family transposase n=1 Tax=Micromonospora sp. WMMA1363 TaxID=3053985 RepID=UPI00259D291A|nr:IS1380 family transposase [Micromonospora sp. WMMA1363]MDM4719520.1 IS1380 family transposase [Micromonospora sp. WMMA1363]MDM4719534.1 IS1380 family transposase [Micromonospora sp. WMMA1363]MDM4719920.1 IS1380 family transposase [Micromonospora sp. WMMA1363]MDM4721461.1 IS1380 family transposase [Micromonospora sp. WMMA1363]MDM4723002.1 IS1380 family transposase [Micromonospora sp. WMMA1363]